MDSDPQGFSRRGSGRPLKSAFGGFTETFEKTLCNRGKRHLLRANPLFTLMMAVAAVCPAHAQTGMTGIPAAEKKALLSHEDSLVMAEAVWLPPDSGSHAVSRELDFPSVIDAVLKDFPDNLRHISGDLVLAQGEFENYASVVILPGSAECTITRWHSVDDTTASWQAKMFVSDDFAAASGEYHSLFRKLQRCYLRLVDGSIVYLNGDWEPAAEGASFTTSTLRLTTGDWRYKEVKVELELAYLMPEWVIRINIVSKKRDDEVGGRDVSIRRFYGAAVYLDGCACDIACQGACEESYECSQLFRLAYAAKRYIFRTFRELLFEGGSARSLRRHGLSHAIGEDDAWCNVVYGNVIRSEFV